MWHQRSCSNSLLPPEQNHSCCHFCCLNGGMKPVDLTESRRIYSSKKWSGGQCDECDPELQQHTQGKHQLIFENEVKAETGCIAKTAHSWLAARLCFNAAFKISPALHRWWWRWWWTWDLINCRSIYSPLNRANALISGPKWRCLKIQLIYGGQYHCVHSLRTQ